MKMTPWYRQTSLVRCVIAIPVLLMGVSAQAVNLGEEANGKSPSELVLHVKLSDGAAARSRQIQQSGINLDPDGHYTLTFWARGSGQFKMGISTKLNAPPWAFFGIREDAQLTREWKKYTFNFAATGAQLGLTRLTFSFNGIDAGDIWLGDVDLRLAGASGGDSENLVANGQFSDGVMQWNMEGKQTGIFEMDMQPLSEANAAASKKE